MHSYCNLADVLAVIYKLQCSMWNITYTDAPYAVQRGTSKTSNQATLCLSTRYNIISKTRLPCNSLTTSTLHSTSLQSICYALQHRHVFLSSCVRISGMSSLTHALTHPLTEGFHPYIATASHLDAQQRQHSSSPLQHPTCTFPLLYSIQYGTLTSTFSAARSLLFIRSTSCCSSFTRLPLRGCVCR